MAKWTDYGPAEFDRSRCPKGARKAPAAQAGLFVMAREPEPPRPAKLPAELPGQEGMFGEDGA